MHTGPGTYVDKVYAYVTRRDGELLVFEGPEHDGLQVPKGTVEPGERLRSALLREIAEESGLAAVGDARHLTTDVWSRRHDPPKWYVRHFYHATVHEPQDSWTHVVTGDGEEAGAEFEFSWIERPPAREFALEADAHVDLIALQGGVDDAPQERGTRA